MGLIAVDQPVDTYIASGAYSSLNPPAIHRVLSHEEIEQSYGLYQGSGGVVVGFFSTRLSGASNVSTKIKTQESRIEETVNNICLFFGLTKDELTKACKIQSRKTLYNWIGGVSTPRKNAMSRIFDLSLIAQAWKQSGFLNNRELVHQPILNGLSVFEMLMEDKLDKDKILFAGSRLNLSLLTESSIKDPFLK